MKAVAVGLLALVCLFGIVVGQYPYPYGYGGNQGGGGGGILMAIGALVIILALFGSNRNQERGTTIITTNLSSTKG